MKMTSCQPRNLLLPQQEDNLNRTDTARKTTTATTKTTTMRMGKPAPWVWRGGLVKQYFILICYRWAWHQLFTSGSPFLCVLNCSARSKCVGWFVRTFGMNIIGCQDTNRVLTSFRFYRKPASSAPVSAPASDSDDSIDIPAFPNLNGKADKKKEVQEKPKPEPKVDNISS